MKLETKNRLNTWKHRSVRLLVFFFVLYAVADSTVLQAYCGNESVGIPPARHISADRAVVNDLGKSDTVSVITSDHGSKDHEDSDETCTDECFGSCSHILIGRYFVDSIIFADSAISARSIQYENKYSFTDFSYLFHPPRIA
jgi:hypothetical protein